MWQQHKFGEDQSICGIIEIPEISPSSATITLAGLGQAMSEKSYLFSNLRKRLAEFNHPVIQFDYRGHGDSIGELGATTLATMLEDTIEILNDCLRRFAPERIFLAGNALGAVIAIRAAKCWKKTQCIPILISPPLSKLPHYESIFNKQTIAILDTEGSIDTQILVPGSDYYTLSDFDMDQYQYVTRLGAHLLYLHGQRISKTLIAELAQLDMMSLIRQCDEEVHIVMGEEDKESLALTALCNHHSCHTLKGVKHYYQHPAAMESLIEIVKDIVLR